jgi:hypothetical protein
MDRLRRRLDDLFTTVRGWIVARCPRCGFYQLMRVSGRVPACPNCPAVKR